MSTLTTATSSYNSFSSALAVGNVNSSSRTNNSLFSEAEYASMEASIARRQEHTNTRVTEEQRDSVNISANAANAYANSINNLDSDMRDFVEARRIESQGGATANVSDDIRQFVDDRRVNMDINRQAFGAETSSMDRALSSEANLQRPVDEQIRQFAQDRAVNLNERTELEEEALTERREEEARIVQERQERVTASSEEIQVFVDARTVDIEVNSDSEYAKSFASNVLYDRYFSANRLEGQAQEELTVNALNMQA